MQGHRDILPLGLLPLGLRVLDGFRSFCRMKEFGDGFDGELFPRLLISWRKLQLSPLEHCPLVSHCQQSPRVFFPRRKFWFDFQKVFSCLLHQFFWFARSFFREMKFDVINSYPGERLSLGYEGLAVMSTFTGGVTFSRTSGTLTRIGIAARIRVQVWQGASTGVISSGSRSRVLKAGKSERRASMVSRMDKSGCHRRWH